MSISIFELFSIGIGPSSSHTVGPMRAALTFVERLESEGLLAKTNSVLVQLYGSLGATGKGHGSDKAILGGLCGNAPESVDPSKLNLIVEEVETTKKLSLLGKHEIDFDPKQHLEFSGVVLDFHSNGLRLTAKGDSGEELLQKTYYSVGGGFVVDDTASGSDRIVADTTKLPYAFDSGNKLLALCEDNGLSISTLMLKNEIAWRPESEIRQRLLQIWSVMQACVNRGCQQEGILPGGLKVKRRAAHMFRKLETESSGPMGPPSRMDWVNLWALAVNEENAAGGPLAVS